MLLLPSLDEKFEEYAEKSDYISQDTRHSLSVSNSEPGVYADLVSVHLPLPLDERQSLLEMSNPAERVERVIYLLVRDIQRITMMRRIRDKVKDQFVQEQEKMLNMETLKAYKSELGIEEDPAAGELKKILSRMDEVSLTPEAEQKVQNEISKLKMMPSMSAEASVIRSYLEAVLNLPWGVYSSLNTDMVQAEQVLNQDHYGLEKVKDRIMENICIIDRLGEQANKAPIICLVGPPGVGKTSLARSIAQAVGRQYVRISLGGVRDESEIRGHRKTYIGAMPGRIIKAITRAKAQNALVLLDEIDKMGSDFRGDPASALHEVLDPEQNKTFNDHYLELDFDLSNVMFITTANSMNIPPALADRMELIHLSSYTHHEKMNIAKRHLLDKAFEKNGLHKGEITFTDGAIDAILTHYTREAGVRDLDRKINQVCRKVIRSEAKKNNKKIKVSVGKAQIKKYLGAHQYKWDTAHEAPTVGCVKGLAWTSNGGDMLSIEALIFPGKGQLIYTGSLGEVMQESIKASLSVVKKHTQPLKLPENFFKEHDIHIHVPEGATPVDGPSAGVTISTALLSAITQKKVRADVAMTGEITSMVAY